MKQNSSEICVSPLGLAPEGSFKLAQADMLACVISDLEDKLTAAFGEKDEEKKVIRDAM